jgi:hypothetical protein
MSADMRPPIERLLPGVAWPVNAPRSKRAIVRAVRAGRAAEVIARCEHLHRSTRTARECAARLAQRFVLI